MKQESWEHLDRHYNTVDGRSKFRELSEQERKEFKEANDEAKTNRQLDQVVEGLE